MNVLAWIGADILAMLMAWGAGAWLIGRRDRGREDFEARVRVALAEANRRYAALPPETTTLDRLTFIYGPDGSGLILGIKR